MDDRERRERIDAMLELWGPMKPGEFAQVFKWAAIVVSAWALLTAAWISFSH